MSAKVRLLDLFDRMPADPQTASHIRHGHVFREVQHIPLKALGIPAIRFGKADLHLPSQPANQTQHPLDGKLDDRRSQSDRKSHESPKDRSLLPNPSAPTGGTRKGCRVLTDPKDRPSLIESGPDMMNPTSRDSKTMIQYAGGHDFLAFSDSLQSQEGRKHVLFHFSTKVLTYAKSRFYWCKCPAKAAGRMKRLVATKNEPNTVMPATALPESSV